MMDGAVTVAACHLLLHAAALATLEPLGLARIDETTWVDDHGWWVVAADFETLGARGTRLVLFADFLWHPRERPARTVSLRVRRPRRPPRRDPLRPRAPPRPPARPGRSRARVPVRERRPVRAARRGPRRPRRGRGPCLARGLPEPAQLGRVPRRHGRGRRRSVARVRRRGRERAGGRARAGATLVRARLRPPGPPR